MVLNYRIYWFFHNLARLPFVLIWMPFEWLGEILQLINIILLKTNGSETLCFPWENRE